ncbi:MAG: hypothetical protein ACLSE8_09150 [Parasutterella sp.]
MRQPFGTKDSTQVRDARQAENWAAALKRFHASDQCGDDAGQKSSFA